MSNDKEPSVPPFSNDRRERAWIFLMRGDAFTISQAFEMSDRFGVNAPPEPQPDPTPPAAR